MVCKCWPWAMVRMRSRLSPPSHWLAPAEHAVAEGRRANLCQPGGEHIPEQTQLGSGVQLLSCPAGLWTPTPNSIPTRSFVPGWAAHSSHKHLHPYRSMANSTFSSCAQGPSLCTAVCLCERLTCLIQCCNSPSTCAFSSQPTWASGYWVLLTWDPSLPWCAIG